MPIPLRRLLKVANPVRTPPWDDASDLKARHVRAVLSDQRPSGCSEGALRHAIQIAALVKSGWTAPIEIDVGVPALGCWPRWIILDGNHRVYAAFMLGRDIIDGYVGGSIDTAEELFGVRIDTISL